MIRPHDDNRALLAVDTKRLIGVAMARVVAFLIGKDLGQAYPKSLFVSAPRQTA